MKKMADKTDESAPVMEAITSRRSVRAFLETPIKRDILEAILEASARAPSGTNMQPWKVYVATGASLEKLKKAAHDAHNDPDFKPDYVRPYYPDPFFEPYLSRRREIGWRLYGLLNIQKGESEKMHRQHGRNFLFFDAPVGFVFTIDERLEIGSWLDYGMFLQNIMTAARGFGLDTCPQAAFAPMHKVLRPVLDIPDSETVVCAMALGYCDDSAIENTLVTDRAPLREWAVFKD